MADHTIDVRDQLLRADFSYGKRGPNTSITLHWNGGPIAPEADPLAVLQADAIFHVRKRGWDGISYHRAYWRDGTCFVTRDWDDTLAASGDGMGNADSSHWQLMIGTGQSPTPEMLAAVSRDLRAELTAAPLEVYPHRYWSSTTCPGDELAAWIDRQLAAWIDRRGWREEAEVTEAEARAIADAAVRAYGDRLQPELEKDRKRIDELERRVAFAGKALTGT